MAKARKNDVPPQLGPTIARLRQAYNMSLGDLSEQSGVAKSIISAIERNETNPTLGTIWRLSQALDTQVDEFLKGEARPTFLEHQRASTTPVLTSEDGLCTLTIVGWLNTVEWVQWYLFEAKSGGCLESEPHPSGSIENLSVLVGNMIVTVDDEEREVSAGETLRYRGDVIHRIENRGRKQARAIMVNILKETVMT